MTVTKYRGVGDMPSVSRTAGPDVTDRPDVTDLAHRIRVTWARARRLAGGEAFMTGVQKFASIEAAQQARALAIRARIRRLRDKRRR